VGEAVDAVKGAVRLQPEHAPGQANLGYVLCAAGRPEEAIAACREAVRLDPGFSRGYANLARALNLVGRYAEAVEALRKARELEPDNTDYARWLRLAEAAAALEKRLPEMVEGRNEPSSPAEALALARVAHVKGFYATAARLSAGALVDNPALRAARYNAACAAALAGVGKGRDAKTLDDAERARWREQAVAWLRADLVLREKQLAADPAEVARALAHWTKDPDLTGIRDEAEVANLPAEERTACRALWRDVAALLERAGGKR
jgi:tetratricopeptide (TPR) repeat protein